MCPKLNTAVTGSPAFAGDDTCFEQTFYQFTLSKRRASYKRDKKLVPHLRSAMNVIPAAIPEVLIIEPTLIGDERGFFVETFRADRYAAHGIVGPFVQDNLSRSAQGVLRGLHLQYP